MCKKLFAFVSEDNDTGAVVRSLKILSYNVWFREDLEMYKRMKAIGDLIQLHSPELICFQVIGIISPLFVDECNLLFSFSQVVMMAFRRLLLIYMT